jgi:hypothetical protein
MSQRLKQPMTMNQLVRLLRKQGFLVRVGWPKKGRPPASLGTSTGPRPRFAPSQTRLSRFEDAPAGRR